MVLGQRIKRRRKQLGMTQTELAEKVGCTSKSTICKVERGEDNLTVSGLKRYADALGTTASELLEGI